MSYAPESGEHDDTNAPDYRGRGHDVWTESGQDESLAPESGDRGG